MNWYQVSFDDGHTEEHYLDDDELRTLRERLKTAINPKPIGIARIASA
jgi:hypothetical protein